MIEYRDLMISYFSTVADSVCAQYKFFSSHSLYDAHTYDSYRSERLCLESRCIECRIPYEPRQLQSGKEGKPGGERRTYSYVVAGGSHGRNVLFSVFIKYPQFPIRPFTKDPQNARLTVGARQHNIPRVTVEEESARLLRGKWLRPWESCEAPLNINVRALAYA